MNKISNKKYISLYIDDYNSYNKTTKNAFIFYTTLLIKYNNNIIKDANLNKLISLTGLNKNSIIKYKKILFDLELIKKSGSDLIINKQQRIKGTKHYKLYLYRSLNFKNTKLIIELKIIQKHINSQYYVIKAKKFLSGNYQNANINRREINKIRKYGFGDDLNDEVFISTRSIARYLNVSHSRGSNLLRELKEKKLIHYKMNFKTIMNYATKVDFLNIKDLLRKQNKFVYHNSKNGKVYLHQGIKFSYSLNTL